MQILRDGTLLGAYTIVRLVGRGGMGEVYEAFEHSLDRRVALKVIAPQKLDADGSEHVVRRFLQEARILAQVNHPNVVTIYSIDRIQETQFIAMEYVEGALLKDMFTFFALSADEATPMFLQMLEGLRALHAKNILHRDLKPHNLMLRPDGQIKILDFGIAKRVGDGDPVEEAGKLVGTISYLPPEVIHGARADVRSDLWSLGAIFYEWLVGQPLVGLHKTKLVGVRAGANSDVIFPEECLVRVPSEMRRIIGRLCDRRPEVRYENAREAIEDLKRFQIGRPPVPTSFFKALSKTVENIEEIKRSVDPSKMDAPNSKRSLALSLMKEIERDEQSQVASLHDTTPLEQEHFELASVVKDSVQARRKIRKRMKRSRRRRGHWPLIVAVNALALIGLFFCFNGIRGLPHLDRSLGRLLSFAAPQISEPPKLSAPAHEQVLWLEATQIPTFAWSQALPAGDYHLQIANDPDFKTPLVSEAVSGSTFRPSRILAEGRYFWRLQSPSRQLAIGPEVFTLATLTPVQSQFPSSGQTAEVNHALDFAWTCKAGVQSYRAQVSHDPAFKKNLADEIVNGCNWHYWPSIVGEYYWRVRVEEPSLATDTWSAKRGFQVSTSRHLNPPPLSPAPAAVSVTQASSVGAAPHVELSPKKHVSWPVPRVLKAKTTFTLKFKSSELIRDLASARVHLAAAPTLNWAAVKGAKLYRLQISRTRDFAHLLLQTEVADNIYRWRQASLGHIFWRVAVADGAEYSPPVELTVLLPAPTLSRSYSYTSDTLFEWEPVPLADKYIIQIATNRKMAGYVEGLSAAAQATLKISGTEAYVRIAVANSKGERISEFSRVTHVTSLP